MTNQGSVSSIYELLGKVDNLNDPIPPLNKPRIAYSLVMLFLVSHLQLHSVITGAPKLTTPQTLAYISASIRLYVRFRVTRCPWWDDFFIVLSMVSIIPLRSE